MEQPVINGDGLQTRDYVYVEDVVRANLAALGQPGFCTYNVGTGTETDVNVLFEHIHRAVAQGPRATHGPAMSGEQQRSCISSVLVERELGVAISTPLAEGIQKTADWFRSRRPPTQ
jgi:UDP-glucose 4-epimerase